MLGPRGGRTTISKTGLMRKGITLKVDEWKRLRLVSFEQERPASEIVREALQRYLDDLEAHPGAEAEER